MNTVIITEKLNTHDHGHMYHQKVGKIGMEIGMEYSYTNTIIRKLFDRNFTYSRKILAMEPREVYAFVINNADLLRHTVREAMATELEQLTLDINQVSKVSFHIPQVLKITDHKMLTEFSPAKVQFFRIDPEDISATLSDILRTLMDLSWLSKFDQDFEQKAFASRAKKTIDDIKEKFDQCVDDSISKDAGEYVVSELARETMVSELDYLDIPLDELVGKKRSGNPGFDFHSQNKITDTVIFGEAKYVATTTAYSSALPQIVDFIRDEKDVEDLPELKPFCTTSALQRAADGRKGFSAAFSAKTTNTDRIIANIKKRPDFQSLLQYEELILVAVDL